MLKYLLNQNRDDFSVRLERLLYKKHKDNHDRMSMLLFLFDLEQ